MKVKSQTFNGVCYLVHQVIKRYRNVSLHVSKRTQCYISFEPYSYQKTLVVWLEVTFQGVMKVL